MLVRFGDDSLGTDPMKNSTRIQTLDLVRRQAVYYSRTDNVAR